MMPWAVLAQTVEPHRPRAKTGRPPFAVEATLRIHYRQQRFGPRRSGDERSAAECAPYREFAK